jgi:hypothetical protein
MEGEEQGSELLFGFFVYRLINEENEEKGEITGMVLVKKSGERTFFTYVKINPKTHTPDKFMEYFKDTMLNNEYDNNPTRVFEIDSLGTLIDKLIYQEVNRPPPSATLSNPVAQSGSIKPQSRMGPVMAAYPRSRALQEGDEDDEYNEDDEEDDDR